MQNGKIIIDRSEITLSDFSEISKEEQKEMMRSWFFENYEDPVHRTPYESREGGYIYIWGGPYNAYDELSIFSGYVPDDVIEELAHDLSMDCPEWTSAEKPSDYDDDYFELIISDNEYYKSFNDAINHIKDILRSNVTDSAKIHLLRLLHVSVITAIETYLSDAFINTVINDKDKMRKFVENNPEFKKKTFNFSEIYQIYGNIESEVKKYLLSLMWHNLTKVRPIYKSTLDIDFPEKDVVDFIFKAIKKRHDLVHRNGKSTDGEEIAISEENIEELISYASFFIDIINSRLDSSNEELDSNLDEFNF